MTKYFYFQANVEKIKELEQTIKDLEESLKTAKNSILEMAAKNTETENKLKSVETLNQTLETSLKVTFFIHLSVCPHYQKWDMGPSECKQNKREQ